MKFNTIDRFLQFSRVSLPGRVLTLLDFDLFLSYAMRTAITTQKTANDCHLLGVASPYWVHIPTRQPFFSRE
jgi:hypothetical protein